MTIHTEAPGLSNVPSLATFEALKTSLNTILLNSQSQDYQSLRAQLDEDRTARSEISRLESETDDLREQLQIQKDGLRENQMRMDAVQKELDALDSQWHAPDLQNNRQAIAGQIELKRLERDQLGAERHTLVEKMDADEVLLSEVIEKRKDCERHADALSAEIAIQFDNVRELYRLLDVVAAEQIETLLQTDEQSAPIAVAARMVTGSQEGISNNAGRRLSDIKEARLNDYDLEDKLQAILDHMTTSRIAEEMDTQTYNSRTGSFFKRAAERARVTQTNRLSRLKVLFGTDGQLQKALNDIHDLNKAMSELVPVRTHKILAALKKEKISPEKDRVQSAIDAFNEMLVQIENGLTRLQQDLCAPSNIAAIKEHATWVSTTVEMGRYFRKWPLIVSLAATCLAVLVLSFDRTPLLIENAGLITAFIFGVSYFFSLRWGSVQRNAYMSSLRDYLFDEFHNTFNPTLEIPLEKVSFGLEPQKVTDAAKHKIKRLMSSEAFNSRRQRKAADRVMVRKNLRLALSWATAALIYVLGTGQFGSGNEFGKQAFVARDATGTPCLYAEGYLVRTSDTSYTIEEKRPNWGSLGKNRTTLERSNIQARGSSDAKQLTNKCDDESTLKIAIGQTPAETFKLGMADVAKALGDVSLVQDITMEPQVMTGASGKADVITPILVQSSNPASSNTPLSFEHRVIMNEKPVFHQKNALLLSFFPNEVSDKDNQEQKSAEFWFDYAVKENLKPPQGDSGFADYLDQILLALKEGLEKTEDTYWVDVQGFSSEVWHDNNVTQEDAKNWNHALAEGRRVAVLDRMKKVLEGGYGDRISVQTSTGAVKGLGDVDTHNGSYRENQSRFSGFDEMRNNLNCWTSKIDQKSDAFEKIYQRSVVILFDRLDNPTRPEFLPDGCTLPEDAVMAEKDTATAE